MLEFGEENHFCPKQGIMNFSPYDINMVRPEVIKLGIVGIPESIEKTLKWLEECKEPIERKLPKKGKRDLQKLFPKFNGFNRDATFRSTFTIDETYKRKVNYSDYKFCLSTKFTLEDRIENLANLFLEEIKFLSKNKNPDVVLCVLNEKTIKPLFESEDNDLTVKEKEQNFRRYLKAKSMKYNIPIQIVRDRIESPKSDMQDPATIAWNFFTALYYKAAGTPCGMIRKDSSYSTCYAGISFFKNRERTATKTSIAQIFNEVGDGVILRGEEIPKMEEGKPPHLNEEQAFKLLKHSLNEYFEAVKNPPRRLVLHKTSNFDENELHGFRSAAKEFRINSLDFVTIQPSDVRIYREKGYPPLRGTHLKLSDQTHILYTRGSVPFYQTYPGNYIPQPLEVKLYEWDESPDLICDEILALTKMNWNNTQFDRKYPITIECARKVGEIMKYLNEEEPPQLRYSFYM